MKASALCLLLLCSGGCHERAGQSSGARSDAVASASLEMSGPSLFSNETLSPALRALRSKADGKWLRLEVRPREIVLQAEDPGTPGAVLELHYHEGRVSEPEHATLRGKGALADNLFDVGEVKLETIPQLAREAVQRIDPEAGSVELVLVRRDLPDSDEVRLRVYVQSPHRAGHLDADHNGRAL